MPRNPHGVCPTPGCPELKPCPIPGHTRKAWEGSTRRQRIRRSGGALQRSAQRVMRRDRGVCHVCGQPGANEVDHVIPVFEGGSDHDSNKAPIHSDPCHREKSLAERLRARGVTPTPGG